MTQSSLQHFCLSGNVFVISFLRLVSCPTLLLAELQTVLLKMAGNIFPSQAVHVHQLHSLPALARGRYTLSGQYLAFQCFARQPCSGRREQWCHKFWSAAETYALPFGSKSEALYLHDGLRNCILQAKLLHGIHKALVELRCPHKARSFECSCLNIVAILWIRCCRPLSLKRLAGLKNRFLVFICPPMRHPPQA